MQSPGTRFDRSTRSRSSFEFCLALYRNEAKTSERVVVSCSFVNKVWGITVVCPAQSAACWDCKGLLHRLIDEIVWDARSLNKTVTNEFTETLSSKGESMDTGNGITKTRQIAYFRLAELY